MASLKDKWQKEVSEKTTNLSFKSWLVEKYNEASNLIIIDLNVIKNKLKEDNITSVENGWTDSIMDILEEKYKLETKLHKLLPGIPA